MKKKLYFFLLAAFLATASQFAFADYTSNLRMHYTFDQIDSTTEAKLPYFADQTANKLDGMIEGNIPLATGYGASGKAVTLNDTDKVVRVPANVFEGVTNFTVALWINQNAVVKWSRIFDFGSNIDHYMFLATDGDIGDFLRFELDVDYDAVDLTMIKATKALTTKKWNHVAITGEYTINPGVDTTATIKIYINGVLNVTSAPGQFKLAPYMLGTTLSHPYLGDSQWPDPTCNSSLDDFRLYTRALSESDIEELTGVSPALKAAVNSLDILEALRTNMEGGSKLDLVSTYQGFDVKWTTSDSTVIKSDGTAVPGDIAITDATLTAALSPAGMTYPMIEKNFFVSVYPSQPPITEIVRLEFREDLMVKRNDTLFVTDEGEVGIESFLVGGAQILPIGDETGFEGSDWFNVYVSNNMATTSANKQWLDMGTKVGEYVYRLRDHSISIFYRRDTTIDHATWNNQGQMLWAFSNSNNLNSWGTGAKPWGAMYFEPDECNVSILDGNAETVGTNALKWGKDKTPLGNTWHNITYTQSVGIGNILVDGVLKATGPMPAPKVQLRKNSNVATFTGTPVNRLGGELHNGRITLKNSMLWGFTLRADGVAVEDCDSEFGISYFLDALNTAMENTTYDVAAYVALMPAMAEARKTLAIGYKTAIHDQVTALYEQCLLDSANRTPSAVTVKALNDSIAKYKTYSTDWVKMKGVLASFADERALNYPGLAVLEEAIAEVQAEYDNYIVETEYFGYLDEAVLTYLKSQVAASDKPANYTFYIKNANFEDNTTGGTKTGPHTGGLYNVPKGWTLFIDGKGWNGSQFQTASPAEGARDYEIWTDYNAGNRVYTFDLSHVIAQPLPAGWYVLSADIRGPGGAGERGGQHIYAFSLTDSVKLKSDTLEADNNPNVTPWKGGYGWTLEAYKKVFVKFHSDGEQYKVGFHADTAFFKFDNMKLAYFGASAEEPVVGDVTSSIKNAGFELGARTTELEGFDAASTITDAAGDVFAPKDWKVLANAKANPFNASVNVIASGDGEGANIYRMKADTLTSVKLYQTLYAPSSGMFKLNANVRADSACRSDARLFAKVGTRNEEGIKLMTAVDTSLTYTNWKKLEMVIRAAVADEVNLGVISSGNFEVDNFTLELMATQAVGIKGTTIANGKEYKVYAKDGIIYINGLTNNDRVSVYDIAGRQISVKNASQIKVSKGMYMIKVNNDVIKQLVK